MGEWRLSADIPNNNFTADTNYIQVRTVNKAADMGNFEAIDDSSDNVASSLQHVLRQRSQRTVSYVVRYMIRATEIAHVSLMLADMKKRKNSRILPS